VLRPRISAHPSTSEPISKGSNGFFTMPWMTWASSWSISEPSAAVMTMTTGIWPAGVVAQRLKHGEAVGDRHEEVEQHDRVAGLPRLRCLPSNP
jgi:hypothetical protein